MSGGYSPELLDFFRFKVYAASVGPMPKPSYEILHGPIDVPDGYLPIKIAQFSSGVEGKFYEWAIFIPTTTRPGAGIFYEIVGDLQTGYSKQWSVHRPHPRWDKDGRGSHLIGWVAPALLTTLERHFAEIPIQQDKAGWNSQHWVVDALKGVCQTGMYATQMNYDRWSQQMEVVANAWILGEA